MRMAGGPEATDRTSSTEPSAVSELAASAAACRASSRIRGSTAATFAGVKKEATTFLMPACDGVALLARIAGSAKPAAVSIRRLRGVNGCTAISALAGL